MIRELHFPTPIYIFDHNDPSLNIQLEKDILNWMRELYIVNHKRPHIHTPLITTI